MTRVSISARHQLPIDEFPRVQAVCLDSLPQAKTWLDDLIGGEQSQLIGTRLTLESGIVIESPQIMAIIETSHHESIEERYHRQNLQFRRGPWHERPKADPVPSTPKQPAAPKPERVKRPDGYVTVAEIAAQLKVKPFDVRQALRNAGLKKPEFGWSFDPSEVAAIKKLVEGK